MARCAWVRNAGLVSFGRCDEPIREITNESNRNNDWTWRDHCNHDCIEELTLVEPLMRIHDPTMKKGNDRQTASKNEKTRFHKKEDDAPMFAVVQRLKKRCRWNGEYKRRNLPGPVFDSKRKNTSE